MEQVSFFKKLAPMILSGKKTGTIRLITECSYSPGEIVRAVAHEDGNFNCNLEILGIEKVSLKTLNRSHALAEGFFFIFSLKRVIREIYPAEEDFGFISFKVVE